MSPSLIRNYQTNPPEVLEAAVAAAARLQVGVSMLDERLGYLYLSPGVALSVIDNARGGTTVHASWRGARAWGPGRICRRVLAAVDEALLGRPRR